MDYIEKSAKTVDDAVAAALMELGITAEEADITVVDQGKPGVFLGLGAKPAVVRVAKRVVDEVIVPAVAQHPVAEQVVKTAVVAEMEVSAKMDSAAEATETAPAAAEEKKVYVVDEAGVTKVREFLQKIFTAMKTEVVMEKFINTKDGSVTFRLHGDDMGIMIGKHGQTLDSLQYLANLVANKVSATRMRVIIDVEDYRDRRMETLTRLARRLADKVRREGDPVSLEPMNPHERKIIHTALQNDKKVITVSEGVDPNRYVVIKLKR